MTDWGIPALGAWPRDDMCHHVIVVGAGIGGLSAAALLATRGLKVLVVEAHDRPGGYCSSWRRTLRRDDQVMNFVFDAGVQDISGLGPGGPLRILLDQLGAQGRLDWRRVRHLYVQDGLRLDVPATAAALAAHLSDLFPGEASGIAAFFAEIETVYDDLYADIELTGGVPMPQTTPDARLSWPVRHPIGWKWLHRPFHELLDQFLIDDRLKRLLTTLSDYVTEMPERLLVREMAPLFGYYFNGGYYPAGGSQRLADVLHTVIEANRGLVLLRTRVAGILTDSGRIAGVTTANGAVHRAPLVIANGDVVTALTELLGGADLPSRYAARVRTLRRGPSAVLVSLALDTLPDLPARVIVHERGVTVGIGNPSTIDSSLAPPDHAAVTLLGLLSEADGATWGVDTPDYEDRKRRHAAQLMDIAETVIPGLHQRCLYRQVATPTTFARYASTRNGNIYGAARGQWCPAIKSPVPGLLLVGAGGPNGAGIEAVVVSGMTAANLITGIQDDVPTC